MWYFKSNLFTFANTMKVTLNNSDHLGVTTSALCIVHCLATPLLFFSQAQTPIFAEGVPVWWPLFNYLLIIISFFAVYRSAQNSSNVFIKVLLFAVWAVLFGLIINEGLEFFAIPEAYNYAAALTLGLLHVYNLKYCSCKDDTCCIHKE